MDERVKIYLDVKRAEADRAEAIYREKVLIAEGLCEREYSPTQERISREYPKWDYAKNKAYRVIPLQVTEDEFREIEEYWEIDKYVAQKKSEKTSVGPIIVKLANILCIVGVIAAVALGLMMMNNAGKTTVEGVLVAVGGSFASWVTNIFLRAFGQLVDDTHIIREKMEVDE